jgi:hypothetical protein
MSQDYALYLDDIRHPPHTGEDWVLVRSVAAMRELLEARGIPSLVSFDYELGRSDPSHCGQDAVESFLEYLLENPQGDEVVDVEVRFHTSSSYGEVCMAQLIKQRAAVCEKAGIRLIHCY